VERFCNAVAAEILVPLADFRSQAARWTIDPSNASDNAFEALAKRYYVSREVVLRRFLDEERVSSVFYAQKTRAWAAQMSKGGSGGDYYNTQNAYLSERFLREVVTRYSRRQLSREEASDLIGVAPKNFAGLEDLVLRGAAA
jgi:Zn-dependent peptidase ImmA (M78 family)